MPYTDTRLQVGKLRHRLQIVNPGTTVDEAGGVSLAVTSPLATVWGRIESVTGRDVLAAAQFNSEVTHRITVRYNPLFSAKMQIWFRGAGTYVRQFEILAILNPDERNKLQYLLCVEINDSTQQAVTGAQSGLR